MTRLQDDLKATAESIAADADRLARVERAKLRRPDDDPRTVELAKDAQDLAHEIERKVTIERDLAERQARRPRALGPAART